LFYVLPEIMTSPFNNPILDAQTITFLTELRDDILRQLPLETLEPALCREVRARLEEAIANLALAGQRDREALARYARAQVGPLIVGDGGSGRSLE